MSVPHWISPFFILEHVELVDGKQAKQAKPSMHELCYSMFLLDKYGPKCPKTDDATATVTDAPEPSVNPSSE